MVSWNGRLKLMSLGSRRVHGTRRTQRKGQRRRVRATQRRVSRRAVYSRLGLIQVQRQCRRLYDDEEHLGDRRVCNFLVAHTSHLYTDLYSSPRVQQTHTHTLMSARAHTYICIYTHTSDCVQIYLHRHVEKVVCTVRSDTTSHMVAWDQFVSGRGPAVMRLR